MLPKGYVARAFSDYMTKETGITIVFESAIVPKWRGSRISFKNVYISRRPREKDAAVSRAQLGKRAAANMDVGHGPALFHEEDDLPLPEVLQKSQHIPKSRTLMVA